VFDSSSRNLTSCCHFLNVPVIYIIKGGPSSEENSSLVRAFCQPAGVRVDR